MSEMSDFLRKQEAQLNSQREQDNQRKVKASEDAALLAQLSDEQWPLLLKSLHDLVANETYDGKGFFWVDDKTLQLGNITLVVWKISRMGVGPNKYSIRWWKSGEEPETPTELTPSLSNGKLVWSCPGVDLVSGRDTAGVAQSLVKSLVKRYENANLGR